MFSTDNRYSLTSYAFFSVSIFQKHRRVPLTNSFEYYDPKNSSESMIIPLSIAFGTRNLQTNQKSPRTKFFLETKSFWQLSVLPHSLAHQSFRTRQMARSRNIQRQDTRNFMKYKIGALTSYPLLWDKKWTFFGDTHRCFTKAFALDRWATST